MPCYTLHPHDIYFITGSLYLLTPFTHFAHPLPPPLPLATTHLFCVSVSLVWVLVVNSTYKRDHTVFVFLWLISLSIMPSRSIHVARVGKISFFLWLNNIPLWCVCVCVCVCVCTHTHIFFIHLSIDGHRLFPCLGCCKLCWNEHGGADIF